MLIKNPIKKDSIIFFSAINLYQRRVLNRFCVIGLGSTLWDKYKQGTNLRLKHICPEFILPLVDWIIILPENGKKSVCVNGMYCIVPVAKQI